MRMRIKKLFIMMIALALILTTNMGNVIQVKADTYDDVYITDNTDLIVTPGQTTHIKIPISAKNYIVAPNITINTKDAPFTISRPTLNINGSKVTGISANIVTNLEFDVTVNETAEIKSYPININFNYYDYVTMEDKTSTLTTSFKIQDEKEPAQLTISKVALSNKNIGSGAELSFTVTNEGEITAKSVYLTMDYGTVLEKDYTADRIKIGNLDPGAAKNISLQVTILPTANTGKNTLAAGFTYKNIDGSSLSSSYKFNVTLTSSVSPSNLKVTNVTYGNNLEPGDKFNLAVDLQNTGIGTAKEIIANIDSSSISQDGIIKNYYSDGITLSGSMKKDKKATVKIPLIVSKYATGGMKSLMIDITYLDEADTKHTLSQTVYVDVTATTTTAGTPNLVISNVAQSPQKPVAGDKMQVTFTLQNKSNVEANEIKLFADGLTGTTFIPVDSDPYKYIEKLKAGGKVKITMPFIVSTSITEGFNNLSLRYTYTGGEGTAVIPVHDVLNDAGSSSIPKLIVSKYTTDNDELKAGSTFHLTFDIYNTNASITAKNIAVTLTQADNVFTVTQGSNSFFINKMKPGETVEKTIEMKVKSDATTKAYPITLTIEYEYDGIKPNTETGEVGLKKVETLNLNAEENARPVADNISISSFDGSVTVGGTATLIFDFYNMGKATLNNVIVALEGDGFTKADGSSYYIGNVEAGASSNVQFDVIPNMEGKAKGTLKISYEDSNGDTIELKKDFEQDVMAAAPADGGIGNNGAVDTMNPGAIVGKKDILPIWAFLLVQIAICSIFIPLTRKLIIGLYKSKLRKNEQE